MFREPRILGEAGCFAVIPIYEMLWQASDIFQKGFFWSFFATTMMLRQCALDIYSPFHRKSLVIFLACNTAMQKSKGKFLDSSIFYIKAVHYFPDQNPYSMWLCQIYIYHVGLAI